MGYEGEPAYWRVEEELNRLMLDGQIRKHRTALVDYVSALLLVRVRAQLNLAGISEALITTFVDGVPTHTAQLYSCLENNAQELGLSQKMLRDFKRTAKADRRSAIAELDEMLLKAERVRFRKEADIAAKVWISFLNCTARTGEATLEKMRIHLHLNDEDRKKFDSCVITATFLIDKELCDAVSQHWSRTGKTRTEFQIYAGIGRAAWEAFNSDKTGKKTTQGTLLKLVIGFGLDDLGAWDFMKTAKSTFFDRRDLVVLAGVRCGYVDPIAMNDILDWFSMDDTSGEMYYKNPYATADE